MRLICTKPMRRDWSRHPAARDLLLERDIRFGSCRLHAKLLVFRTATALRKFWKDGLKKGELGVRCKGAVNGLYTDVLSVQGKVERNWIEADPRYYCVIGLVKGWLSMEIVTHESIHAGFCYAKRVKRSPWKAQALHFDEEAVCYPAGRIAAEITHHLYAAGLCHP